MVEQVRGVVGGSHSEAAIRAALANSGGQVEGAVVSLLGL